MTKEKLLETLALYEATLTFAGLPPEPLGTTAFPEGKEPALKHCHWMVNEMRSFVKEGKLEKAFRWLGFVQGVFFMTEFFSIEEMRDHNRD